MSKSRRIVARPGAQFSPVCGVGGLDLVGAVGEVSGRQSVFGTLDDEHLSTLAPGGVSEQIDDVERDAFLEERPAIGPALLDVLIEPGQVQIGPFAVFLVNRDPRDQVGVGRVGEALDHRREAGLGQ